jgi:hypothetical protein
MTLQRMKTQKLWLVLGFLILASAILYVRKMPTRSRSLDDFGVNGIALLPFPVEFLDSDGQGSSFFISQDVSDEQVNLFLQCFPFKTENVDSTELRRSNLVGLHR